MSGQIRAATANDISEIRVMLREYIDWIALDLHFQDPDAELAGLPGKYAPPDGALLVAADHGSLVGMIGLRPLDEDALLTGLSAVAPSAKEDARRPKVAEMKRLYVRPEARGRGLARQLITHVLDEARRLRYIEMRLDTLPMMNDAQALYVAMGFHDIAAYYETPISGTRFMAKHL